jgi:pimeloyl-ACP methyl ester carboxylesterase
MQEGTTPGPGGVPIYFRKFGNRRRGVVVPNAAWLARDFEILVRDRTVVVYHPRGRGNSGPLPDKSQVTLDGETEDLDLVRRHCELYQMVLVGWSYHGAVAANYASRHPDAVERLIVSGPMAPSYSDQAAAALQPRLDMQAIADLMKSPPADPAAASKVWHDVVLRGYFADGGAYARSFPKPRESEKRTDRQREPASECPDGFSPRLGLALRGGCLTELGIDEFERACGAAC